MNAIAGALKIHTGESRLVVAMVGLSFTVSFGQAIGLSAADALFFERIGTDVLPVMYLLQGGTAFALMLGLTGALGRVDRRRAYLAAPAVLATIVLAERATLLTGARWIYPVLWLTVPLATLVQTVSTWGIGGSVTDTRQAKRLFPLFAAGGILGSVLGGLLTHPFVRAVGTEDLLVVWAGALAAAFVLSQVVLPPTGVRPSGRARRHRRPHPSGLRDTSESLGYVMRSRLLSWMSVAAVLFSVLFYSLFLPWATAATERYPNAADLASFLGLFWAAMTGLAFVVSALATNRLFGRFGIASMVMVLPVLYVGTFGTLLVSSTFVTLVVVRFVDGVWLQGVASPGWETLTNVVPETRRDQVRAFLNGGPSQAGTAIAGLIALVGNQVLSARQLALVGLVAAAVTVYVTRRIRGSYASSLVDALRAGRPQVFPELPVAGVAFAFDRDAQAIRTVLDAASDERPSVRRLAVHLLGDADDERVRPTLERALRDEDATVRAESVVALARRLGNRDRIEGLLPLVGDSDPAVAASAAAAVVGRTPDPSPARRLFALVHDLDPAVRSGALERLRDAPANVAVPLASAALEDETPSVRAAAVLTLATLDADRALEPAVRLFEDPSPIVREAAADASASIGNRAVDRILASLDRPGAREAALEALARLDLAGRDATVRAFVTDRTAEASHDHELAADIPHDGDATDLLRVALMGRARTSGRIALGALSLISTDTGAMRAAIGSLDAHDAGQVANALETLEATADAALVRPLLRLWEPTDDRRPDAWDDWLERVLNDDDRFIASCGELALLARGGGDDMARARASMPAMERVLFLRKVPLFEALAPADLHAIAQVAEEDTFTDGDFLAVEGEVGDALHIIVSGAVRVDRNGSVIAMRGSGEVVGEMSLITRGPRIASLVADGDVRTIRIGRHAFESMVHDRPDIAIGVMRVLAERLGEHGGADPSR
ncbi:MAG TPA: Npt1/Npt2 family nucleotide transporter [Actinomycetota bacterium]